MATFAVFAVLGGGAYAASTIGAGDIAKNAVRSKHIKQSAVKASKIANGAVTAPKLADGVEGLQGEPGEDGTDGTARAYAKVTSHQNTPCLFTGGISCVITHAQGVTSALYFGDGAYCVVVPGIDPATVPAAVTVDGYQTQEPKGDASAVIDVDGCGADTFKVHTYRQPSVTVRNAAGDGTTVVADNAVLTDDVSFTIVIP